MPRKSSAGSLSIACGACALVGILATSTSLAQVSGENQLIKIKDKGNTDLDWDMKNNGSSHPKDLEGVKRVEIFDGFANPQVAYRDEFTIMLLRFQGSDCSVVCKILANGDSVCNRKCK